MARTLGDAWIAIKAQGDAFGAQVSRIVDQGTKGKDGKIKIVLDDLTAKLDFASLQKSRDDLASKIATIKIDADDTGLQSALLRLKIKLDKLNDTRITPAMNLQDAAKVSAQLLKLQAEADHLNGKSVEIDVKAKDETGGLLSDTDTHALLGSVLALVPALATVSGVAIGAGAAIGGAFIAGAGAAGAFGAVAKPVLTTALTSEKAVQTAQIAYTAAIDAGTKKSVAYKAEQIAISKAYAGQSSAQIDLSKQLGTMANAWQAVKAAQTPVVAGALQPWLKSVTDLTGKLGPIIGAVSPVIGELGSSVDTLINSKAFTAFRDFIAGTGSGVVSAAGNAVIGLIDAFIVILPQFTPLIDDAASKIAAFGPAVEKWAASKKTAADITAFMQWFHDNGPAVGALLKNVAGALKNLAPGLASGGALELQAVSDFMGLLAKLPAGVAGPIAALAGAVLLVVKGVKLWSDAQKILDVELFSNPIGLVVLAVVALGLAFYEAWTKSAGFRDFVKSIGAEVVSMGILTLQGLKQITDAFDDFVGAVIDGAAKAFGWVPGIGPKLKAAAASFAGMKDSTDASYDAMIAKLQAWQAELLAGGATSKETTAKIDADFAAQQKASSDAKSDLDQYSAAIKANGVNSDAAKAARQQLIKDLTGAGVNSKTANTDVANYTAAVKTNGIDSDAAKAARQQLITDILNASKNATAGKTAVGNLTTAIKDHGTTSDAYRAARQQLITDLENSGTSAKNATALVDALTKSIGKIPASKEVTLFMTGTGQYSIQQTRTITATGQVNTLGGHTKAAGGMIPGTGHGDTFPAMLTPGELVVPVGMVKAGAVDHLRGRLPGFASGGLVQQGSAGVLNGTAPGTDYSNFQTSVTNSLVSAMRASIKAAEAAAAAAFAASAGGGIGTGGVANSSARAALQSAAAKAGWTGAEWSALNSVEMREAGYSLTARNPSSGAYGLAQFIDGPSEYASYGGNSTTAAGQAVAMVNYIKQRYGDPIAAWNHELSFGWYGKGGLVADTGTTLAPGWNMRYNGTGRPERLAPGSSGHPTTPGHAPPLSPDALAILDRLDRLTAVTGQQGGQFAGAISGAAGGAALRGSYSTRR